LNGSRVDGGLDLVSLCLKGRGPFIGSPRVP
jgi:hypothetical protein